MKGIKKTLSVIITIVLVLSAMPLGTVSHAVTSNNWHWPTASGRKNPYAGWPIYTAPEVYGQEHQGQDFYGSIGDPIYSTCDGEVFAVSSSSGYGNYVRIKAVVNGETVYIMYAHMSSQAATVGTKVSAGQLIGYVGNTGNDVTGPHLHYEINLITGLAWSVSQTRNPDLYLPGTSYTFEKNNSTPPSFAYISVDKLNYNIGETVLFSLNTDAKANYNTLWIYRPDGSHQYYEEVGKSYSLSFLQGGYYEALVQAWNDYGNYISNRISFYVGAPQYAYISTEKNNYYLGETVVFTFNTAARANYNTLWIYKPDGSKQYFEEVGKTYSLSFSQCGKYEALVQAWNDVGSCISDRITFYVGQISVSFNSNGGTCSTSSKSITYNSTYGSLPVPTRTGYTFIGWYTAASGGTAVSEDTTVTTTTDHTLYAHWRANVLTIHYDCFDSYPNINSSKGFYFGDYNRICTTSSTLPHQTAWNTENVYYETLEYGRTLGLGGLHDYADFGLITPSGYEFCGWKSGDNGELLDETTQYAATDLTDEILEGDCDVWLSAKHTFAQYTVSFDANGGCCGLVERTMTYGYAYGRFGALPTATRDGYMFLGWFTAREGGQKITDDTIMTRTNNHTLYAHYEKVFILGDADGDGDIGLKDVVQITRYLAGGWDVTVDLAAADVNHDGEVNLKDAVILRRYLVGGWNVELK